MNTRFTAWLSESERQGIHALAEKYGTSENYVVRLMVRKALGLPIPAWMNDDTQAHTVTEETTPA